MSTLDAVRQMLAERFGDSVAPLPVGEGITVCWTAQDGTQATLTALVTEKGNLKVEFTRNLVEGIIEPNENDDTAIIQINSEARIKVRNKTDSPTMFGIWNMSKPNHTVKLLIDTIDILTDDALINDQPGA